MGGVDVNVTLQPLLNDVKQTSTSQRDRNDTDRPTRPPHAAGFENAVRTNPFLASNADAREVHIPLRHDPRPAASFLDHLRYSARRP